MPWRPKVAQRQNKNGSIYRENTESMGCSLCIGGAAPRYGPHGSLDSLYGASKSICKGMQIFVHEIQE